MLKFSAQSKHLSSLESSGIKKAHRNVADPFHYKCRTLSSSIADPDSFVELSS
jgi:hypothetical protein